MPFIPMERGIKQSKKIQSGNGFNFSSVFNASTTLVQIVTFIFGSIR